MASQQVQGALQQAAPQLTDGNLIAALKVWHRARETANRYNRDMLQYGAMVAGAIGMVAGAGGA
ncbi:MAG: hypothetical protein FJ316_05085 [SAR202 cluster bacterium]|nr:hypothetical protein [SAR202 cluster bacterium]